MEGNSVRSAATALANLRIGYKLGRRTRIILDIFNLFNREASDIDYFYCVPKAHPLTASRSTRRSCDPCA